MIFPAIYAIIIGTGMIGQWSVSYATKRIPELQSEPIRIWFHIAAEMVTAIMLVAAGIALLATASWAPKLYFISIGMLFYTAIVSPGYFAQQGNKIWVLIFALIISVGLISLVFVMRHS